MNHSRLQATAMVDLQHPECILQQGLHPRKVKVTSTHALHPRMVRPSAETIHPRGKLPELSSPRQSSHHDNTQNVVSASTTYQTMVSFEKNAESSQIHSRFLQLILQTIRRLGSLYEMNLPFKLCLLVALMKTLFQSYIFNALLPTLSSAISVSFDWMISRSLISLFNTLPNLAIASVCCCKVCDASFRSD